jgi:hypothetical protein
MQLARQAWRQACRRHGVGASCSYTPGPGTDPDRPGVGWKQAPSPPPLTLVEERKGLPQRRLSAADKAPEGLEADRLPGIVAWRAPSLLPLLPPLLLRAPLARALQHRAHKAPDVVCRQAVGARVERQILLVDVPLAVVVDSIEGAPDPGMPGARQQSAGSGAGGPVDMRLTGTQLGHAAGWRLLCGPPMATDASDSGQHVFDGASARHASSNPPAAPDAAADGACD